MKKPIIYAALFVVLYMQYAPEGLAKEPDCVIEYQESNDLKLSLNAIVDSYPQVKERETVLKNKANKLIKNIGVKNAELKSSSFNSYADSKTKKLKVVADYTYSFSENKDDVMKKLGNRDLKDVKIRFAGKKYLMQDTCTPNPFTNMAAIMREEIPAFCKSIEHLKNYMLYIDIKLVANNFANVVERLGEVELKIANILTKHEIIRAMPASYDLGIAEAGIGESKHHEQKYSAHAKMGYHGIWGDEQKLQNIAQDLSDNGINATFSQQQMLGFINICPDTWKIEKE